MYNYHCSCFITLYNHPATLFGSTVDNSVAVLHVVLGSKTGLVYPSLDTISQLRAEFGERLVVVVDACQLRCRLERIREFTDAGEWSVKHASRLLLSSKLQSAVLAVVALGVKLFAALY